MINLEFSIRLSKKQQWEYSQLDDKYKFRYLLSFIGKNDFGNAWTNLSQSIPNPTPFQKLRMFNTGIWRGDSIRFTMNCLKRKLEWQSNHLLSQLSIAELRKLTGKSV